MDKKKMKARAKTVGTFLVYLIIGMVFTYIYEVIKYFNNFFEYKLVTYTFKKYLIIGLKYGLSLYLFYGLVYYFKKWVREKEDKKKIKINDPERYIYAIRYFTASVLIVFLCLDEIFYLSPLKLSFNIFRFLWCIASSFLAFAILVFRLALHDPIFKSPFPSYITYYSFILITISCIAFSIFNGFIRTSGYIFYYASFALCFFLASLVDNFFLIALRALLLIGDLYQKILNPFKQS